MLDSTMFDFPAKKVCLHLLHVGKDWVEFSAVHKLFNKDSPFGLSFQTIFLFLMTMLYPTIQSIIRSLVVWFAMCYEKLGAFFIHKSCPKVQIFFNASYRTEKLVFGLCTESNWFIRS